MACPARTGASWSFEMRGQARHEEDRQTTRERVASADLSCLGADSSASASGLKPGDLPTGPVGGAAVVAPPDGIQAGPTVRWRAPADLANKLTQAEAGAVCGLRLPLSHGTAREFAVLCNATAGSRGAVWRDWAVQACRLWSQTFFGVKGGGFKFPP
jgi:hypothetical protein